MFNRYWQTLVEQSLGLPQMNEEWRRLVSDAANVLSNYAADVNSGAVPVEPPKQSALKLVPIEVGDGGGGTNLFNNEQVMNLFNALLNPKVDKTTEWVKSPMFPVAMTLGQLGAAMMMPRARRAVDISQPFLQWAALQKTVGDTETKRALTALETLGKLGKSVQPGIAQLGPRSYLTIDQKGDVNVHNLPEPSAIERLVSGSPKEREAVALYYFMSQGDLADALGKLGIVMNDENWFKLFKSAKKVSQNPGYLVVQTPDGHIEVLEKVDKLRLPPGSRVFPSDVMDMILWKYFQANEIANDLNLPETPKPQAKVENIPKVIPGSADPSVPIGGVVKLPGSNYLYRKEKDGNFHLLGVRK